VEPDLDDTLPGRNSAGKVAEGLPLAPDFDDTIISAPRSAAPSALPELAETQLAETDLAETQLAETELAKTELAKTEFAQTDVAETGPIDYAIVSLPARAEYGVRVHAGGDIVPLDNAVYVGRRPLTPRIRNGEIPTLVSVTSPANEVSGTHLEVRQVGTSIVVTDLQSTNGSRVSMPGGESRTLLGGDAMVVIPGTRVDIGDGNVLEIVSLTRLHHREG
jgi:hypothetical protein